MIGDDSVLIPHSAQLKRVPRPFPTLQIEGAGKSMEQLEFSDFKLIGYDPHQKIDMKMSV